MKPGRAVYVRFRPFTLTHLRSTFFIGQLDKLVDELVELAHAPHRPYAIQSATRPHLLPYAYTLHGPCIQNSARASCSG